MKKPDKHARNQERERDTHEKGGRVAKAQATETDHPGATVRKNAKAAERIGKGEQQSGARKGEKKGK
jgi:hypothetical protein